MTASSAAAPPRRRASWRAAALALGVPLAVAVAWAGLMTGEAAGLVAPLLGPWAGLPLGHRDCTMASSMPGWSLAVAVLGLALVAPLAWVRPRLPRLVLLPLLTAWSLAWSWMAMMSVVNTQS